MLRIPILYFLWLHFFMLGLKFSAASHCDERAWLWALEWITTVLEFQLHLLGVWPWADHKTSMSLNFLNRNVVWVSFMGYHKVHRFFYSDLRQSHKPQVCFFCFSFPPSLPSSLLPFFPVHLPPTIVANKT